MDGISAAFIDIVRPSVILLCIECHGSSAVGAACYSRKQTDFSAFGNAGAFPRRYLLLNFCPAVFSNNSFMGIFYNNPVIFGYNSPAFSFEGCDAPLTLYHSPRYLALVDGYVKAWRGKYTLRIHKTPGTVCNAELSRQLSGYAAEILGEANVHVTPPMKGAEDFAYVTRYVPSFFGFLGAGKPDYCPLHNSRTIIDEDVLAYGAAVLANCAIEWLNAHK